MTFPNYKNRVSRMLFRKVVKRNCQPFFKLLPTTRGAFLDKAIERYRASKNGELYRDEGISVRLSIHSDQSWGQKAILGKSIDKREDGGNYLVIFNKGSGERDLTCWYMVCDTLEEVYELLDAWRPGEVQAQMKVGPFSAPVVLVAPEPPLPAPEEGWSGRQRAIQRAISGGKKK